MIPDLKSFKAILFDWGGTAVEDRVSDAAPVVARLRQLLNLGIRCVIIAGTDISAIEKRLGGLGRSTSNRNLLACTNRGSEVYAFDDEGHSLLLYRRLATSSENAGLDRAIVALNTVLSVKGLSCTITFDRLNRRKLDLIPLPEWSNPKSGERRRLLDAVNARIREIGIDSGLKGVMDLARDLALRSGLGNAKITTDIKYVEIGLTDKADSIRWIKTNVLEANRISPGDVLLVGDELSAFSEQAENDMPVRDPIKEPIEDPMKHSMKLPGLEESTYLSVGNEPGILPLGVLPVPGGPEAFLQILDQQIRQASLRSRSDPLQCSHQTPDRDWTLHQEGFDPSKEREMETIFSIGNGYLGVRGSTCFLIPGSQADLFIAGVYDSKASHLPYSEIQFFGSSVHEALQSEIVSFPFPFRLSLRVAGQRMDLTSSAAVQYQRTLDLKKGCVYEKVRFRDTAGRETLVHTFRCASLADPHLLLHEVHIERVNHSDPVEIDSSLEDPDLTLRHPHLRFLQHGSRNPFSDLHLFGTKSSLVLACIASKTWVDGSESQSPEIHFLSSDSNRTVIRRAVVVYTNRETQHPLELSEERLRALEWNDFEPKLQDHTRKWEAFWDQADVQFSASPSLSLAQRFSGYQLRISVNHDSTVSVPARSLIGRAYEGHIFWDADVFVLPFFLHNDPATTRSMLSYRFHTLNGARQRAIRMGYRGACYAWESTQTGEDVTPDALRIEGAAEIVPIFTGQQQIHVTAAVSYAIWNYWKCTGDDSFMESRGTEILIETARFWASRVHYDRGSYHIRRVVGPDEYHYSVDDNAFTNWMARFNLRVSAAAANWLKSHHPRRWHELSAALELDEAWIREWNDIADLLYVPKPNPRGVIEQFSGFFDLEPENIDRREQMKAPLGRLLSWQETNRRKIIKQADVLMIPFLFPEAFTPQVLAANYLYYEPITDHASSLSPPVHAAIAARVGFEQDAKRFFEAAVRLDLRNSMNNSALGFHTGCAGGAWQALVYHMLGIRITDQGLFPAIPRIPREWGLVSLKLLYRGKSHPFSVRAEERVAA